MPTTNCENDITNDDNSSKTSVVHPDSEFLNDLNHENKTILHDTEKRLRLNVLRLLINLKSNNATETCIETCSKDLLNVLMEYKDVNVSYFIENIQYVRKLFF